MGDNDLADLGSVLGGRYRLMELLGQGGMASIYRAHDAQLDRDVAVKILRPEYGRDPDFGTRFRQEALSAAALNHPNVVAVYDFGQDEHGPFIVMELIDGEDLASIMRRNGPLAPRQAARVAAEVARALSAAHARGIVHRDVKPGNIMLSSDGRVKVADFGIARAIAEAQMTLPGTTLGSVHYFSPEQARGEQTTASSDIYALGIVLFEMLTGRRPFEGDSAAAIAVARLSGRPPEMSEVRAGIPPALEAIVRRAMATDPGERFPSAAAMADALDTYLADRSLAAAGANVGAPAPAPFSGAPVATAGALGAASLAGAMAGGAAPVAGAAPYVQAMPVAPAPRADSSRIPYSDDAYAGRDDDAVPPPRGPVSGRSGRPPINEEPFDDDDGGGGSGGPWVWISGLLGLAILAVVAFLIFRLLSGPPTPTGTQVIVPDFVGKTFDEANVLATEKGLVLVREFDPTSTAPVNTVIKQNPSALTLVQKDSQVTVTLAAGSALVAVPDIKNLTEPQALTLITQAGLLPGLRSEAADPVVPAEFDHQPGSAGRTPGGQGHDGGLRHLDRPGTAERATEREPVAFAVAIADAYPDAHADADSDTYPHAHAHPDPDADSGTEGRGGLHVHDAARREDQDRSGRLQDGHGDRSRIGCGGDPEPRRRHDRRVPDRDRPHPRGTLAIGVPARPLAGAISRRRRRG